MTSEAFCNSSPFQALADLSTTAHLLLFCTSSLYTSKAPHSSRTSANNPRMRALRYHGAKDLRVDNDVPEPQCKPHEIKVKPAYIGICGTDLHEYSTPTFVPQPGAPHGITVSQSLDQVGTYHPTHRRTIRHPYHSLSQASSSHVIRLTPPSHPG